MRNHKLKKNIRLLLLCGLALSGCHSGNSHYAGNSSVPSYHMSNGKKLAVVPAGENIQIYNLYDDAVNTYDYSLTAVSPDPFVINRPYKPATQEFLLKLNGELEDLWTLARSKQDPSIYIDGARKLHFGNCTTQAQDIVYHARRLGFQAQTVGIYPVENNYGNSHDFAMVIADDELYLVDPWGGRIKRVQINGPLPDLNFPELAVPKELQAEILRFQGFDTLADEILSPNAKFDMTGHALKSDGMEYTGLSDHLSTLTNKVEQSTYTINGSSLEHFLDEAQLNGLSRNEYTLSTMKRLKNYYISGRKVNTELVKAVNLPVDKQLEIYNKWAALEHDFRVNTGINSGFHKVDNISEIGSNLSEQSKNLQQLSRENLLKLEEINGLKVISDSNSLSKIGVGDSGIAFVKSGHVAGSSNNAKVDLLKITRQLDGKSGTLKFFAEDMKVIGSNLPKAASKTTAEIIPVSARVRVKNFLKNEHGLIALGVAGVGVGGAYLGAAIADATTHGDTEAVNKINQAFVDGYNNFAMWSQTQDGKVTMNYIDVAMTGNLVHLYSSSSLLASAALSDSIKTDEALHISSNLSGAYLIDGATAKAYELSGTAASIATGVGLSIVLLNPATAPYVSAAYGMAYIISLAAVGDSTYADNLTKFFADVGSRFIGGLDLDPDHVSSTNTTAKIRYASYLPFTDEYSYYNSYFAVCDSIAYHDYYDKHVSTSPLTVMFDGVGDKVETHSSETVKNDPKTLPYLKSACGDKFTYNPAIFNVTKHWGLSAQNEYTYRYVSVNAEPQNSVKPSAYEKTGYSVAVFPTKGKFKKFVIPFKYQENQVNLGNDQVKYDSFVIPNLADSSFDYHMVKQNGLWVVNSLSSNGSTFGVSRFVMPFKAPTDAPTEISGKPDDLNKYNVTESANWKDYPFNLVVVNNLATQRNSGTENLPVINPSSEDPHYSYKNNGNVKVYTQSSPGTSLLPIKEDSKGNYDIDHNYLENLLENGTNCPSLTKVCFSGKSAYTSGTGKSALFSIIPSGAIDPSDALEIPKEILSSRKTEGFGYVRLIIMDPDNLVNSNAAYRISIPLIWTNGKPYLFLKSNAISTLPVEHVLYNKDKLTWLPDTLPSVKTSTRASITYDNTTGTLVFNMVEGDNPLPPYYVNEVKPGVSLKNYCVNSSTNTHLDHDGNLSAYCSVMGSDSIGNMNLNSYTSLLKTESATFPQFTVATYDDLGNGGKKVNVLVPSSKMRNNVPLGDYLTMCKYPFYIENKENGKTKYAILSALCPTTKGEKVISLDYNSSDCHSNGSNSYVGYDQASNRLYCASSSKKAYSPFIPEFTSDSRASCDSVDSSEWHDKGIIKAKCSHMSGSIFKSDWFSFDYGRLCTPGDLIQFNPSVMKFTCVNDPNAQF